MLDCRAWATIVGKTSTRTFLSLSLSLSFFLSFSSDTHERRSSKRFRASPFTNLCDCSPVPAASPVCCRSCSRPRTPRRRRSRGQKASSPAWTWRTPRRPCTTSPSTDPRRRGRTRTSAPPSPTAGPPSWARLAWAAVSRPLQSWKFRTSLTIRSFSWSNLRHSRVSIAILLELFFEIYLSSTIQLANSRGEKLDSLFDWFPVIKKAVLRRWSKGGERGKVEGK